MMTPQPSNKLDSLNNKSWKSKEEKILPKWINKKNAKKIGKIFLKSWFWAFIIGLIIGVWFSPDKFYYHQYFSSTFEHPDFKEGSFTQRYQKNYFHTYFEDDYLKTTIQNRFPQKLKVKTILELPDYMDYECYLVNADEEEGENCEDYWIEKEGSHRRLYFNITVNDTPKVEDEIKLITREKAFRLFGNEESTSIKIFITK